MIRFMCRDEDNLYVVREEGPDKWSILFYPNGASELDERVLDHFGESRTKRIRIPLQSEGLEEWVMQFFLAKGIQVEEAEQTSAQEFYDGFVEGTILKSDLNVPWQTFLLEKSAMIMNSKHSSESNREDNKRILARLKKSPHLIGIPNENLTFYDEVSLSNGFSSQFDSFRELMDYIRFGQEPSHYAINGLTRPDLVIHSPGKSYLIEIKAAEGKKLNRITHRRMRSQLALASQFMHHNFDTDFVLIGVEYRNNGREEIGYRTWTYKPETRKLSRASRSYKRLS